MTHSLIIVIVNALWILVIVTLMKWSHESRSRLRNVINAQTDLADKRQATILQRDATIRARNARIEELEKECSSHLKGLAETGELFARFKDEYAEYRNESGNAIQALTRQLDELKDRHSRLLEFHERLRASAHKALVELRSELEN